MVSTTVPIFASLALGGAILAVVLLLRQQKKHQNSTEKNREQETVGHDGTNKIVFAKEPWFLPFLEDTGKVKLGVKALSPQDNWIDIGSTYLEQMAEKKQSILKHWDTVCQEYSLHV